MQTVTTLPILQTVSDATTHYVGLQPAISGSTTAQYVNRSISFSPASNTLNIAVNVNFLPNAISGLAIADSGITSRKIAPLTRLVEQLKIIPGSQGGASNSNVTIFLDESSIYYLTSNASGNLTFDLRASSTINLDSFMVVGQSITTVFITTQGGSQFTANVSIDGTYQIATTRWSGNAKPTYAASLTNQQLDVYTFTTIKTAANTYSTLGSRTSYGVG